jgi:hypothetical protein
MRAPGGRAPAAVRASPVSQDGTHRLDLAKDVRFALAGVDIFSGPPSSDQRRIDIGSILPNEMSRINDF